MKILQFRARTLHVSDKIMVVKHKSADLVFLDSKGYSYIKVLIYFE